jgi:hypothetical protein
MENLTQKPEHRAAFFKALSGNLKQDQNGSIIVVVLLILAIMTVIGLVSSDTVVTENFIIRNTGIQKQNINIVEAASMEGLQEFMQVSDDDPDNFDVNVSSTDWLTDKDESWTVDDWYDPDYVGRLLNANNSNAASALGVLTAREEANSGSLRYGLVGWDPVGIPQNIGGSGGSESLVVSGPGSSTVWRRGRIITEYASLDVSGNDNGFGMLRMEIGVRRQIPIN